MISTIESTHRKIIEKITLINKAILSLREVMVSVREHLTSGISVCRSNATSRKYTDAIGTLDSVCINILLDKLEDLHAGYNLSIVEVLSNYYGGTNEEMNTRAYYMIIGSENFVPMIDEFTIIIKSAVGQIGAVMKTITRPEMIGLELKLDDIMKDMSMVRTITIAVSVEKQNYEICICGRRMDVYPEVSELHCPCGEIKMLDGTVFRDEQFYPQEGQKTKHGGYETSRHYKFHMERLQAQENKTFDDADLGRIEYVLGRDKYDRGRLDCEQMREILKDSSVALTHLNDHCPLLVKIFGGPVPPLLDFQENKLASIRFSKTMRLYDIVNPEGGNKPYYPYFIYKILEEIFKYSPKRRILQYIHLQGRDTVVKNDRYWEQICLLADPLDGLIYSPTDPAGRI